jgi:hypothetical protein
MHGRLLFGNCPFRIAALDNVMPIRSEARDNREGSHEGLRYSRLQRDLTGCYQESLNYVPSYPRPYTYARPCESVRPLPSHHHPQRTSSFRQPEDDGSAPVSWPEVEEVNIPISDCNG